MVGQCFDFAKVFFFKESIFFNIMNASFLRSHPVGWYELAHQEPLISKQHYDKIMGNIIAKHYKLALDDLYNEINSEAKDTASRPGLANRMEI